MDNLLSGRRVLVVEDEMLVLLNIEDMLADLGCTSVSAAATVDQALALIEAQGFDAAMVDVNLDRGKSYAVADALAARGVPFLFSTGYSGQSLKDGYRDRPVLGKPYRNAELAEALVRLLRLPGVRT
ncbi:MAG: response regulator [Sphingosinicella sp.]|uniref:response regulator n=1 Tax=Sphingosinicella sp. TaxID=1917971 RepID=UPI00403829A5